MFETFAIGGLLKKWWPALAGAALVAVILILTYCSGRSAGKSGEVVKQQKAEIQVQKNLGKANENAAGSRVESAVEIEQQRKELEDARKATNQPDRQRALRGCVILRQQGYDTADIPACRGYPTGY